MWQFNRAARWARKLANRSLLLAGTTTLLASLTLLPSANAQIVIGINPPVCTYGYYNYAPYGCAPSGFYGPGYFYNGVFLGVGPWASWGYGHGWGEHRFGGGGGGFYVEGHGDGGGRAYEREHGRGPGEMRASRNSPYGNGSHRAVRHNTSHSSSHGSSHAAHGRSAHGGDSHGGGEHHREQ